MSSEWTNVSKRTKKKGKIAIAGAAVGGGGGGAYPKRSTSLSRQQCGQISPTHNVKTNFRDNDNDVKLNVDDVLDRLQKTIDELLLSSYWEFVYDKMQEIVGRNGVTFNTIVGLGLGTLSSPTSLLQLAMYLCLCRKLLIDDVTANTDDDLHNISSNRRVVYDPNMTSYDRSVCERLGITVLSTNLKGKHRVNNYTSINNHNGCNASVHPSDDTSILDRQSDDGYSTLFFLPHCPYRLYCNLLWENWQDLDKLFILGNSFESYASRRFVTTKTITGSHMRAALSKATPRDITDSVSIITTYIEEISLWPSQLARSTFLNDSKDSKYCHYLENAMCDLSFMYLSEECKHSPDMMAALIAMKPSDEVIDQAAMADDELF